MSKERFKRSKSHVNIGTIGHVDHGKGIDEGDGRGTRGEYRAYEQMIMFQRSVRVGLR